MRGATIRASLVAVAILFGSQQPLVADAEVQESREIVLRVGEQKSLSARGVRSYSEGDPGVADVRVTRDQSRFVIVGKHEGTTSLLLIHNDGVQVQYTIRVIASDASRGFGQRENIRLDLYFVLIQDRYTHQIGLNLAWQHWQHHHAFAGCHRDNRRLRRTDPERVSNLATDLPA